MFSLLVIIQFALILSGRLVTATPYQLRPRQEDNALPVSPPEEDIPVAPTEDIPSTTGTEVDFAPASVATEILEPQVTEIDEVPAQIEDEPNPWKGQAEKWATTYLGVTYDNWISTYSVAAKGISLAKEPGLCTQVSRAVVDTCKRGVQAQVAQCKQSVKTAIATCKDNVGRKVDKCKKSRPFNFGSCELLRSESLKCETDRINVPGCEVSRASMVCCEGFRTSAQSLCTTGISTAQIQKQVQDIQGKCSIALQVAVAAAKSYLSGQVVGFISQMSAIKEIGDGIQVLNSINSKRAQYERWADGLVAISEGRVQDAQRQLVDIGVTLAPGAAGYIEAVQAAATKNVGAFLGKVTNVAGEVELINEARKAIPVLKAIKSLQALKAEAQTCRYIPVTSLPNSFAGFANVKSEAEAREAFLDYTKEIDSVIRNAAKCASVVTRITRLPSIGG